MSSVLRTPGRSAKPISTRALAGIILESATTILANAMNYIGASGQKRYLFALRLSFCIIVATRNSKEHWGRAPQLAMIFDGTEPILIMGVDLALLSRHEKPFDFLSAAGTACTFFSACCFL